MIFSLREIKSLYILYARLDIMQKYVGIDITTTMLSVDIRNLESLLSALYGAEVGGHQTGTPQRQG